MRLIDSHVHLSDYPDPSLPVKWASSVGILLVSAGVGAESSARTLSISAASPAFVRTFVGLHPSEAEKEKTVGWVEECLGSASGVGEIGLDPRYSEVSGTSLQMKLFEEQLSLAESCNKPVQVHSRGAERECLEVLSTFRLPAVQLHWFQRNDLARAASERGYYTSFGPALIISKKLQGMAAAWDIERVMAESDGPVRFTPFGGANGPLLVPSVVFKLAQAIRSTFDEASRVVRGNSLRFLGEKA